VIRVIRLYSGPDGQSQVDRLSVAPVDGPGNLVASQSATRVRFEETPAGSALDWHVAPHRQYVITLTGVLEFTTRDGETFTLGPGQVLLAEDTAGGGHRWRLVDDQPWQRVYVELPPTTSTG
jgi:quercetin dioxygenase-like cupin family protein